MMVKKTRIIVLAALAVTLIMASVVGRASLNQFSGDWVNTNNNTSGITRLHIQLVPTLTVRAWGKCTPTDCDWGTVPGCAYGPNAGSNISSQAEAVIAVFDKGFAETVMVITSSGPNKLQAETYTRFTDGSGRTNYRSIEKFTRGTGIIQLILPAPPQISPPDGAVFSHYPRTTNLVWGPVAGAASYTVEIEYLSGSWHNFKTVTNLHATNYSFDFVGAQPGRWRVWAVGPGGQAGSKSPWREFKYTI